MKSYPALSATLGALLLTGCVIDARERDTQIGPERVVDLPVTTATVLKLDLPASVVRIEGVAGDRLRAELRLLCPARDSRCATRLRDLRWESSVEDDAVRLATVPGGLRAFRDAELRVKIQVPALRRVDLDLSAGELRVVGLRACLRVDMGAGDVDVKLPLQQVARVRLDAGVGDASLRWPGHRRSAPRSWLVGAQMEWTEGPGHCAVDVDLQAGDIRLELTEG